MTFRLNALPATNEMPPGVQDRAAYVTVSTGQGAKKEAVQTLFRTPLGRNARGMPVTNPRNRYNGRAAAHNARLRALILPRLTVGCTVPTARFVGRLLGVDESTGGKHLRRLLRAEGVVTEKRKHPTGIRVYIVEIPALRAAA